MGVGLTRQGKAGQMGKGYRERSIEDCRVVIGETSSRTGWSGVVGDELPLDDDPFHTSHIDTSRTITQKGAETRGIALISGDMPWTIDHYVIPHVHPP